MRLRKLVVFDRLMARLLVVAHDRWILKGAVALHLRLGARFRTTRDMDLVDLILISSLFQFTAGRLRSALRATFDARGTHSLPAMLPPPPTGWGPALSQAGG